MCGIFGKISINDRAVFDTLQGIQRLLHRGYDSMGIVFATGEKIKLYKISQAETDSRLQIDDLADLIPSHKRQSSLAMGHTRWAVFGNVNYKNAHPHYDTSKRFFIVHNGNAENMDELVLMLGNKNLYSETDSEVIINLISQNYKGDMLAALESALNMVEGANAFVVMDRKKPDRLYAANKGGPLILAQTKEGVIVSSDPMAFEDLKIEHQTPVADNEVVEITCAGWKVKKINSQSLIAESIELNDNCDYKYVMEKEIFEQPGVLANTVRGRILWDRGNAKLGGIEEIARELRKAKTFHFIGCGTAYHAGQYGQMLFNRFGIEAKAWVASEFCYAHPIIDGEDVFIFLSQSGETADTIEVLNEVKIKGNLCLGLVNVQGSRIARETDAGIYIRAGKEVGVASTKAYTAQLATIVLLAVFLARQRKMTIDSGQRVLRELEMLSGKARQCLEARSEIKKLAKVCSRFKNYYFLGRYFSHISAEEGALKLKEIAYVHAEGYPLGEMKHGPLALVEPDFCSVVIIPNDSVYKKGVNNIREIKSRNGFVWALSTRGANLSMADRIFTLPDTPDYLMPIVAIIPLQLFSYYMAIRLGRNPDRPRNLAKTVTVG